MASSTTNDFLKITIDGVTSTNITLGTITNTDPDAVAAGIAVAINANPALLAAGVGVTVEFDEITGGFGIISKTTGPTSSVTISELGGNAGSILGLTLGAGIKGAVGTVSHGTPDVSSGIRVLVKGGELGARGSVSFIRGVADRLDTLLDSFLAGNGILSNRTTSLNKELEGIESDRESLKVRLEKSEARLRANFLANDLIISKINSTADFLTAQLNIMEGIAAGNKN